MLFQWYYFVNFIFFRNGGQCEEGDTGPLCKCRGYAGPLCSLDVDECLSGPCLHGATCVNAEGG